MAAEAGSALAFGGRGARVELSEALAEGADIFGPEALPLGDSDLFSDSLVRVSESTSPEPASATATTVAIAHFGTPRVGTFNSS